MPFHPLPGDVVRGVVIVFQLLTVPLLLAAGAQEIDLTTLARDKDALSGSRIEAKQADLTNEYWAFLRSKDRHANLRLRLDLTVLEPAKHAGFFGSSWSVWPDATFGDQ